ncbi:MAG: acyl-CoA thioesterase, partial [Trebonia sp.]
PEAPPPESLPSPEELQPPPVEGRLWRELPIDMRYVDGPPWERPASPGARQLVWIRANGKLPDDPLLHVCVVAYASDYSLLGSALVPHGRTHFDETIMMASLDHAMWFHRPGRVDDWLLYAQQAVAAGRGRGLATGRFFGSDGAHLATVVQEGMIRPVSGGPVSGGTAAGGTVSRETAPGRQS